MTHPHNAVLVLFPAVAACWGQAAAGPDPTTALLNLGGAGVLAVMLWTLLREQSKQHRDEMAAVRAEHVAERASTRAGVEEMTAAFRATVESIHRERASERTEQVRVLESHRDEQLRHHEATVHAIHELRDAVSDLAVRVPPPFPPSKRNAVPKENP